MDIAAMATLALDAAHKAQQVSDDLHLELAHNRVRHLWPEARCWTRRFEQYDDMVGGEWLVVDVQDGQGTHLLPSWEDDVNNQRQEIDDHLSALWLAGEDFEENTRYFDR